MLCMLCVRVVCVMCALNLVFEVRHVHLEPAPPTFSTHITRTYVRTYNGDKMSADSAHYRELSEGEWRALPAAYLHAAHAMLYAEWPGKFLDKYDFKYAVMVRD